MNKQLVETWRNEFETAWADGLRKGYVDLGVDQTTAWAAYYALKIILQTVEPAENASDLETVWQDEFGELAMKNGNEWMLHDGNAAWQGFLMAKRSQPSVVLPKDYGNGKIEAKAVHKSLTAAGIKYKVGS